MDRIGGSLRRCSPALSAPSSSLLPHPNSAPPQALLPGPNDLFERQIRHARMIVTRYLVPPPLPNNLLFKVHPKDARASSLELPHASNTIHSGVYNSNTPYDLDEAFEGNHSFLEVEHELCGVLAILYGLEIPHQRRDYRNQRDNLVAEVKVCLDRLLRWTSARWELAASNLANHRGSIIDSLRYIRPPASTLGSSTLIPLLVVASLHSLFGVPRRVCEVVLAGFRVQFSTSGDDLQRIPKTLSATLRFFDLDPDVRRLIHCVTCGALYPYPYPDPNNTSNTQPALPQFCIFRHHPGAAACNASLLRNPSQPRNVYFHQVLRNWLARFICRPGMEDHIRHSAELARASGEAVNDIMQSQGIREFRWPDSTTVLNCPDGEYRLFFALSVDVFNPLAEG
ncbi:hypothetical protein FA13DRAFT_1800160 [Coprinellus micaceus]|uniref:Uncharacterized protein n=1 Tax=Coprinellus micaceus TaxID=71717 RepID=A0A4Y7SHW9_COPMI|nr:hypothetical protein FA13DRAFT_1800160 [Coprinellus micaceus]